jgi:hypothetical protein
MAVVISLREVAEAIELQSDELEFYLDPDTGQIVMVTEDARRLVGEGRKGEAPAWQREMLAKVRAALESDRVLRLPDRFGVSEWAIMERFSRARPRSICTHPRILALTWTRGRSTSGAKAPQLIRGLPSARLKSCPFTGGYVWQGS